ncbi:hypothetical protein BaRGS_00000887 [Batillaria attramentaria]|uniref:Uncharacterized protein n=1 Tax=Batillaria attramentaria TaxID=370345 RepID=A0ABD0M8P9_9CAEN
MTEVSPSMCAVYCRHSLGRAIFGGTVQGPHQKIRTHMHTVFLGVSDSVLGEKVMPVCIANLVSCAFACTEGLLVLALCTRASVCVEYVHSSTVFEAQCDYGDANDV